MNASTFAINRQVAKNYAIQEHFLTARLSKATNLYSRDLRGHYGCVNALEFSHNGSLLASGGDDHRTVIWRLSEALDDNHSSSSSYSVMKAKHMSNIFCLAFDCDNGKVISGGNDEQVIVHDLGTGDPSDVLPHEDAVYGVSPSPDEPSVLATACQDGAVRLYDLRKPPAESDPLILALHSGQPFHAAVFCPSSPRLLATANNKRGIGLWDARRPARLAMNYGEHSSAMSVRFSSDGRRLLALRRRKPPVLFNVDSPEPQVEFDHPGYYNSCTMKSCSFGGFGDEFAMSGSDDFNVYVWRIPEDGSQWVNRAQVTLKGHRSIVNQVRFCQKTGLAASAGVEKVIKIWSSLPLPGGKGGLNEDEGVPSRVLYTRGDYIRLTFESGDDDLREEHSSESTEENERMIAFFDSLVQKEVDGGFSSSDSSEESEGESIDEARESDSEDRKRAFQGEPGTISSLISNRRLYMARSRHVAKRRRRVDSDEESETMLKTGLVTRDSSSSSEEIEEDEVTNDVNNALIAPSSPPLRIELNGPTTNHEVDRDAIRAALQMVGEQLERDEGASSNVQMRKSTGGHFRRRYRGAGGEDGDD